ncbi:uncharacterized protein LOC141600324 isoform X2 [Silene latifolia]|uniref:uncharacterized protein LOC141600324 isoform X2 n=1 Tax=Silene latifolia TaxID=37657 RepID=UPI003D772703
MGVLSSATPWVPKDDLLLKNSIEAGASLESLARGAVQFSHRYTIKELQDRWHTLLYDPVISAEATAKMVEFERSSKSNKVDNSKEAKYGHGKRKAESIRRCYYAMRKKKFNEQLSQGDLSFLVSPADNCFINGAEGPGPQSMLGDPMPTDYGLEVTNFDGVDHVFPEVMRGSDPPCDIGEFSSGQQHMLEVPIQQNILHKEVSQIAGSNVAMEGLQANSLCDSKGIMCSGFEGINPSNSVCETSFHRLQYASSPPAMPDWKSNEGIRVPEITDDGSISRNESELDNHMSCAALKGSTDCKEGYFAELSDSLLNFTSDDEMLIIDGGKNVIDKTYLGLGSLLVNSRDDLNDQTMHDRPELEEPTAADEYHGVAPNKVKIGAAEIQLEHSCDIYLFNHESQIPPSTATVNPEFPEFSNVVWCTLNTEDPEIPCNDNLPLPGKARPASVLRRTQSEAKRFRVSHPALHTTDLDARLNDPIDDFGDMFEASRGETDNGLWKASGSQGGLCNSSTAVTNEPSEFSLTRRPSFDDLEKSVQVAATSCIQTGCAGINQKGHTSLTTRNPDFFALDSADPLSVEPDGEPLLSEDEQFSDSGTDIPYFSDIESTILDMDLGPEDQDSLCSAEVAKYHNEDAMRVIIRLEQNAHSYMQRAIASHGAFAILYGRHSKHYIKKPEVLLGRGTDDIPVDIDLSREGRANKISRRQAIIKMENDGTFNLRNMGKCSIYVNSKEVLPRLTLGLHSDCLIEIRGMSFIFETNRSLVMKYLENAALRSETKRPKI